MALKGLNHVCTWNSSLCYIICGKQKYFLSILVHHPSFLSSPLWVEGSRAFLQRVIIPMTPESSTFEHKCMYERKRELREEEYHGNVINYPPCFGFSNLSRSITVACRIRANVVIALSTHHCKQLAVGIKLHNLNGKARRLKVGVDRSVNQLRFSFVILNKSVTLWIY